MLETERELTGSALRFCGSRRHIGFPVPHLAVPRFWAEPSLATDHLVVVVNPLHAVAVSPSVRFDGLEHFVWLREIGGPWLRR